VIHHSISNDIIDLEAIAEQQGGKLDLSTIILTIQNNEKELQNVFTYLDEKGIEVIHSDTEPDNVEHYESGIQPFDPAKIQIRMMQLTVHSINERIKHFELEFNSAFQRMPGLWSNKQKSQLIESIMLRIPLPAFYFDAFDDNKWIIIDGLQRISSFKEFMVDGSLSLTEMEFFTDLNGMYFSDLPRSLQRRLEESNINAYIVDPTTPHTAKFNIFKRINTGGLTLTSQEIRNALYQGRATEFINMLAEIEIFRVATCYSIPSLRMLDREYCLRYIAFNYTSLEEYAGVADDFLNNTMHNLNHTPNSELDKRKKVFNDVLGDCYAILGNHAFRKMARDGRRRPINKTLFEGWTICIRELSPNDINILKKHNNVVKENFISLCEQPDFINALKASDKKSLYYRIHAIREMLGKVIKQYRG
jgi:hypothetical protein